MFVLFLTALQPYLKFPKLVWFIAPTVTLCHQQACLFEKHLLQYQLRFLSGNDNVDRWSDQAIWDAVLENVRVVVSTPAVLLDTLTHGFVKLTKIALLIFDEAHMCRGNHPASAIMQKFYHPLLLDGHGDHLPKILGLTASPVVSANPDGLEYVSLFDCPCKVLMTTKGSSNEA